MAAPCWNSGFGTPGGYPRQTTSAIHEYLQKYNKGTKVAIWKRLLNPKTTEETAGTLVPPLKPKP